jgi:sulfhydrogenase subunit delta
MGKPKVGIFGLTGCAGDQLAILNCEDRLLDLFQWVDIKDFLMASSDNDPWGALDIAFVEGAVLSRRDEQRLKAIRERARLLVAIGTCASRPANSSVMLDVDRFPMLREIYGETSDGYDSVAPRALAEVVPVDLAIHGCPIEEAQFLEAVSELLRGSLPVFRRYPVCSECRMRENNCLLLEKGQLCWGPLTEAGCNARCPSLGVACIGCRGPAEDANAVSARDLLLKQGFPGTDVERKLRILTPDPKAAVH